MVQGDPTLLIGHACSVLYSCGEDSCDGKTRIYPDSIAKALRKSSIIKLQNGG